MAAAETAAPVAMPLELAAQAPVSAPVADAPAPKRERPAPRAAAPERLREQRPTPLADPQGRGFDDDQVPAFLLRGKRAAG
jgi:hypothetical protein